MIKLGAFLCLDAIFLYAHLSLISLRLQSLRWWILLPSTMALTMTSPTVLEMSFLFLIPIVNKVFCVRVNWSSYHTSLKIELVQNLVNSDVVLTHLRVALPALSVLRSESQLCCVMPSSDPIQVWPEVEKQHDQRNFECIQQIPWKKTECPF